MVGRESLHYLEFHICSASRESVQYQKARICSMAVKRVCHITRATSVTESLGVWWEEKLCNIRKV